MNESVAHSSARPRQPAGRIALGLAGLVGLGLLAGGCGRSVPSGSLVLAQVPVAPGASATAADVLDERYPAGSRVLLVSPPFGPDNLRVLSRGLVAAGDPVVAPDGRRVIFVGKMAPGQAWQIYEGRLGGQRPKALTAMPGGAMPPALIATDEIVFSSPVPKLGEIWTAIEPAALYARDHAGQARRLTFGRRAAVEPTVLQDGRILFVSARVDPEEGKAPSLALFTVNNDGSEVLAYALNRDGAPFVRRPRELPGGLIGFLASESEREHATLRAEAVRSARPFASRTNLFPGAVAPCRSLEPGADASLLACFESRGAAGSENRGSFAVYRIAPGETAPGELVFDDPAWHEVEATRLAARSRPMGHMSAMNPERDTGILLCLDANFTRVRVPAGQPARTAERVRVLAARPAGGSEALGEVVLQSDGSFMAEVPADTALGFESLDAEGQVIHRLAPSIWVRPGENRSCVGCHEPYNRSPRNARPLAVGLPPARIPGPSPVVTQTTPTR